MNEPVDPFTNESSGSDAQAQQSSRSSMLARRLVFFAALALVLMVIVLVGVYLANSFLFWTSEGPIFGWNTTYEDTTKQFDDFAAAVKSTDEHVAAARKKNFEAVYAIALKPATNEKEGMSNFAELNRRWGEAQGIEAVRVSEKELLFAEFRKELAKGNSEEVRRLAIRDSRILSFVFFILLLLIGVGASWILLRMLGRSAARSLLEIRRGGKTGP